jgi:hypothetical protein
MTAAESGKNLRVMSGVLVPENMIQNFATDQHGFPRIKPSELD